MLVILGVMQKMKIDSYNCLNNSKLMELFPRLTKKQEVTIRPLIAHLANPESLTALLRVIKEKQNSNNSHIGTANEGDE